MEKMTYAEAQERWQARAAAQDNGLHPSGYRFCQPGGHMARIHQPCPCKATVKETNGNN